MQTALNTPPASRGVPAGSLQRDVAGSASANALANYQIIRRNGAVVPFEPNKIAIAMMKAFPRGAWHARARHRPVFARPSTN